MSAEFASRGSQRWLQVAVTRAPHVLDQALQAAAVIPQGAQVHWRSPRQEDGFAEYRDEPALACLGITAEQLRRRPLQDFWPARGPVWDALGTSGELKILVEAKAHIAEAASPGSKAGEHSLKQIIRSLEEARRWYAPKANVNWHRQLYQYANRLAFHYFLSQANGIATQLVFLDFYNAPDVHSPDCPQKWEGATEMIHALLGLPRDLRSRGIFHVHVDVRQLEALA